MSIWSIVTAIIMLGILVTIHELGHFWVARLLNIKAYEVSIFVGPKLLDWRRNNVEYSIRALPFGAYVRFNDFDENGNVLESDDPQLLINSPRWKRLLVALAGPFMNLLLGVVIFSILFCATGYASLNIGAVREGSQLSAFLSEEQSPFEIGDTILEVNGHRVLSVYDYYYEIDRGVPSTEPVTLLMRSKSTGDKYQMVLTPEVFEAPMLGVTHYDGTDNKYNGWEIISVSEFQNNGNPVLKVGDYLIAIDGISVADEGFEEMFSNYSDGDTMRLTYVRNGETYESDCVKTFMKYTNDRGVVLFSYQVTDISTFLGAIKNAVFMPYSVITLSVKSIGEVFHGQEEVYNMVSGPIGMTTVVSDVVDDVDDSIKDKFISVVEIAGIITIGLTFTNLLPIPGLDGVQVILIIVEMIIGHELSKKSEGIITAVGYVLLIGLVIFAFASDIIRIILE